MNTKIDNYTLLLQKLDEFIRKFHLNKLIRGLFYSFTLIIIFFLTITLSEYYFHFSSTIRKLLFYGFCIATLFVLYKWVLVSILHLIKIGKSISHEQAASIIGAHFTNVQDKLLNILQLQSQNSSNDHTDLIQASIDQKITSLSKISFTNVIDLRMNKRYLKFILPPFMVFIIILFSSPNLIKDGTKRLIYNNVHFKRKAPFDFVIMNEKLEALQFGSFRIKVKMEGSAIPADVYINIDDYDFKLSKQKPSEFSYSFKNLQKDLHFFLEAGEFRSDDYKLTVIPKPMILSFDVFLDFPSYLSIDNERIKNIGDFTIPEGTHIQWKLSSKNTEQVALAFGDSIFQAKRSGDGEFTYSSPIFQDASYTIYVSNDKAYNADSISYVLTVIPDQYPSIKVDEFIDSIHRSNIYFIGETADDHGLTNLYFKYKRFSSDNTSKDSDYQRVTINLSDNSLYNHFTFFLDITQYGLNPGDRIDYFFEAWDNDGVNGSKSARTPLKSFELSTLEQFEEITDKANTDLKEDLEKTIEESKALKEEIESLQDKLYQKKTLSWDDKKSLESVINKQQQIQNRVKDIQENFKNNLSQQSDYKQISPETAQKYQQLQKLFDDLLSDEMKELFEEFEALLEKLNKNKALEELDEYEFNSEMLEKDLDRMLSLFKQLEFEQKMNETIEKLKQLAKDQEELEKESKSKDSEELAEGQEDINEQFEKVKEDISQLDTLKEELETATNELDKEQLKDEIQKELNNSLEKLQQNSKKKASESQKKASQDMKKLSENLQSFLNSMQQDQLELDLQAIRQLLENLITLSFNQEELLNRSKSVNINTPQYNQLVKEQYDLKDNAKMIEDSLASLSKTLFQIESFVNKEVAEMNKKISKSINDLENRKTNTAAKNQQYVMTSVNNLALIISEIMKSLQEQMSQKMSCKTNCQKPGQGNPSMSNLSKQQKELNKKIKGLQKTMKGGKMPQQEVSKALAQMASRQAALREALRQLSEEYSKDGNGELGDLEKIQEDMEKTETDMVNKRIPEELIKRQEEILTRLLSAESAERERELDTKRESENAKEYSKKTPPQIEEYLKKRKAELELYKTLPPNLKPYYRDLVEKYFKSISY